MPSESRSSLHGRRLRRATASNAWGLLLVAALAVVLALGAPVTAHARSLGPLPLFQKHHVAHGYVLAPTAAARHAHGRVTVRCFTVAQVGALDTGPRSTVKITARAGRPLFVQAGYDYCFAGLRTGHRQPRVPQQLPLSKRGRAHLKSLAAVSNLLSIVEAVSAGDQSLPATSDVASMLSVAALSSPTPAPEELAVGQTGVWTDSAQHLFLASRMDAGPLAFIDYSRDTRIVRTNVLDFILELRSARDYFESLGR